MSNDNRHILVLDDTGEVSDLVSDALTESPLSVEVVEPSDAALNNIRTLRPAAVVIAADNTGGGGHSLIPRARRAAGRIPLILVSGRMSERDVTLHEKQRLRADVCLRTVTLTKQVFVDALSSLIDLGSGSATTSAPEVKEITSVVEEVPIEAVDVEEEEDLQPSLEEVERLQEQLATAQSELTAARKEHRSKLKKLSEEHTRELDTATRDQEQRLKQEQSKAVRELEQLQAEHQQTVGDLEAKLAQLEHEHTTAIAALESELETLKAAHEEQLRQLSTEHTKHLTKLEKQTQRENDKAVTAQRQEHDQRLEELTTAHRHEIEDLQAQLEAFKHATAQAERRLKDELEHAHQQHHSAHDELEATLTSAHDKALEELEKEHQSKLDTLEKQLAKQLTEAAQEHEAILKTLTAEHAQQLEDEQQQHAKDLRKRDQQLARLTGQHEQELTKLNDELAARQRQLDALTEAAELEQQRLTTELETAATQHAAELAKLTKQLTKEKEAALAQLADRHLGEKSKALEHLEEELTTQHQAQLAELEERLEHQLQSLRERSEAERNKQADEHGAALAELEDEHNRQLEALKQEHEEEIENKDRQLHEQVASLRDELTQEQESLATAHEKALNQLKEAHHQELSKQAEAQQNKLTTREEELAGQLRELELALEQAHSATTTQRHELETQLARLTEEHQAQLAQQSQTHDDEIKRLNDSLEKHRTTAEQEATGLSAEVKSLKLELIDLANDHEQTLVRLKHEHDRALATNTHEHTAALDALEDKLQSALRLAGRRADDLTRAVEREQSRHEAVQHQQRLLIERHAALEEQLLTARQQLVGAVQAREHGTVPQRVPGPRVLVVGADSTALQQQLPLLRRCDIEIVNASTEEQAYSHLISTAFDLVIVDETAPQTLVPSLLALLRSPDIELWSPALVVLTSEEPDEAAVHESRIKEYVVVRRADKGAALRAVASVLGLNLRIPTRLVAELDLRTSKGLRRDLTQTINISLSGVLFKGGDEYIVGSQVGFELTIPGEPPIRGKARIMRQLEDAGGELSRYGARFESFHDDGQQRLRQFLARTLQE